ncbi:MAG: hypothetical protein IKC49_03350 [Clostridia bacterium]|nr:hypothetical protein [Clostridia bacterium]
MIENLRDLYMDEFVKSGKIEFFMIAKNLEKLVEDVYNADLVEENSDEFSL